MGGFINTTSSIKEQTPYGYIDLTAFYLRTSASTSFFLWGASASYIKLKTVNSKTNLQHARMTLNPLLIDLRLHYPLLSLFSSSDLAGKMNFFVNCGTGVSYVTLSEGSDNRTSTYFTVQPGCGISMNLNEYVYVVNQYDYLYIHQSKLSYSGVRARLGVGYVF